MSSQPPRDLEQVVLRSTSTDGTPRARVRRSLDDAWEAVVREELVRMRRGRARPRRFTARVPRAGRPASAAGDEDAA